jgi:hypothetical protein
MLNQDFSRRSTLFGAALGKRFSQTDSGHDIIIDQPEWTADLLLRMA